jgi:hypothetical protein
MMAASFESRVRQAVRSQCTLILVLFAVLVYQSFGNDLTVYLKEVCGCTDGTQPGVTTRSVVVLVVIMVYPTTCTFDLNFMQ